MREIKFRYFFQNEETGLIHSKDYHLGEIEVSGPSRFSGGQGHINIARCQFVGLKDKNGKEIYEGDILSGWRKGTNSDLGYTGCVEWQREQCGFVIRCGKYIMEILSLAMSGDGESTRLDSFEIVGNQVEHPHLLNTNQDGK